MVVTAGDIRRAVKAYREGGIEMVYQRGFRYLFEKTTCVRDESIANEHRQFVNNFFRSKATYDSYINEWKSDPLRSYLREAVTTWEKTGMSGANNLYYLTLYAYIRSQSPEIVVETGVKDGWATFYTLAAIMMNAKESNDTTTLYSIALPEDEWSYREDKQPGWIIPYQLSNTDSWSLLRTPYKQGLIKVVDMVDTIDVFNHDSIHTTSHMLFEFELASTCIDDGVIISDNIYDSMAFYYFSRNHPCKNAKLAGGSDLDHYWWSVNTATESPDNQQKPLDNLGAIWNIQH